MNPAIKADVVQAIAELKVVYGEDSVEVAPETQGGAYVIVKNIQIGDKYVPPLIWCGFLITFNYPHADVYPHYINHDLKLADGRAFANPITLQTWQGKPVLQISRRSKEWNPAEDTAETKLAKIIQFLKNL